MKPLKQATRQHIEKQQLTEAQIQQLLSLQQPPLKRSNWPLLSSLATCFLLVVLIASQWLTPGLDMPQVIAEEVAKNHIKMKPLEVETSSLQDIRRYFTQLDFSPVNSAHYRQGNSIMLGGRYCSIQGITAAQLRFEGKGGNLQTLYETSFDPEIFGKIPQVEKGEQPAVVYLKGLQVKIWVEKGLLMASVKQEGG